MVPYCALAVFSDALLVSALLARIDDLMEKYSRDSFGRVIVVRSLWDVSRSSYLTRNLSHFRVLKFRMKP